MAGTHTEVVLNNLTKPELVQLLLNTEANMAAHTSTLTAEIKELSSYLKKLEADVAIVESVNSSLVEQVVQMNGSAGKMLSTLDAIGILTLVKDDVLEEKVCDIFHKLGIEIGQRDIQACHRKKNQQNYNQT